MIGKTHKKEARPVGTLLAALDVGSSKIACFISRVVDEQGTLEVLGVGHHASAGIKSGTVIDLDAAENAIRETVHAAENMAADVMKGYPLRDVIVNLPGVHARSHLHSAQVSIAGHEVTQNDIRRALAKAQELETDQDCELIHTIPVGYKLDGQSGIRDPRGMVARDMGVDIHLVTGETGALQNIATSIERSHLDIEAFCVSPYAAGLACLVEDERDLGCTVIDMGGGVTSIAVFQEGHLVHSDAIPLGGKHITNDIAKGLTTGLNDAERLKVLYGGAMAAGTDENDLIDVPRLGEDNAPHEPHHVPRALLIGIIQPRLEEIFELVRARLKDSGLAPTLGRRVVLTGGTAQMTGISELAAHVLDKQIRIGRPLRLNGLPEAVSGPAFATTAGLLTYAERHGDDMPGEILSQIEPGNLWEAFRIWLRENW